MNYRAWLIKAVVCGLSMAMLVPSFASAVEYGPNTISAFLNKEGRETVFKPKWANFVLHTALHRKFYAQRSNMPVWIDSSGYPNQMATVLRNTLLSADRHGLHPKDYWNATLESAFVGSQEDPRIGITFEFVATEAVLRYGQHLFQGRVDPRSIDEDIKYEGNKFADKEITIVAAAVNKGPDAFTSALEVLAPQLPRYKDFMKVLEYFRNTKAQGNWSVIRSPGMIMQKGIKADAVVQIRQRFNELGYNISVGSDHFDEEFDTVLRKFQKENGLAIDGAIGINRSAVLQTLNKSIDDRLSQIEVTMEKLRWLPRTFESRFIFVNLATSEFRLFEGNKVAMSFRTVNGQKLRQTPSMKDYIQEVVLNPTWTVPDTLAIQDKWPLLKGDRKYLVNHKMVMTQNGQAVDSTAIDWKMRSEWDFDQNNPNRFIITQLPGYDNALGVVKFPLVKNNQAIYMHDTNERDLFSLGERHKSSGCVRLEEPLKLAEYLLQDQKDWSLDRILQVVPSAVEPQSRKTKYVPLTKRMPVYLMYVTVERGSDGSIRFLRDDYGQDERLSNALKQVNMEAIGLQ